MSHLSALFARALGQADFTYPWAEFVSKCLHTKKVDQVQAGALVASILDCELSTPRECFSFFRKGALLALCGVNLEVLEPFFRKMESEPYWHRSSLGQLYALFCNALCGRDVELSLSQSDIPLLEGDTLWTGGWAPRLQENAEAALLYGFLGVMQGDEAWQQKAVHLAEWLSGVLDHQAFPFYSLWAVEGHGELCDLLATLHVVFKLADAFTKDPKWHPLAKKQLEHLENVKEVPLLSILFEGFLEKIDLGLSFCVRPRSVGTSMVRCQQIEGMSFALTQQGWNSGMGGVHKGSVKIVNMGPWGAPLGECGAFGVKQSTPSEGWVRVQPTPYLPETYVKLDVRGDKEKIELTVTPHPLPDEGLLSFAFLVQSEAVQIGNHRFLPATMKHYIGESALISFHGGEEKLEIILPQRRELELIPLAGGNYFWGANFLLAFSLSSTNSEFSCSISID